MSAARQAGPVRNDDALPSADPRPSVFIWPVLSVAVVGGYGFVVWMSQLILGPPGPPPVWRRGRAMTPS